MTIEAKSAGNIARALMGAVTPKARVIMLAQLMDECLKMYDLGQEETAAAIKSLLLTRSRGFSIAQKAMTESLMSRDLLTGTLAEAFERVKL